MKAILDRDIITNLTPHGSVEIGEIPEGVGLERMRWDGKRVVDLAGLSEIWIEPVPGGGFVLHAVEVLRSHRVPMRYADRRRLVLDAGGVPRLKTEQEQAADSQAAEASMQQALLTGEICKAAGPLDQQVHQLRKTIYLLIEHIVNPSAETGSALAGIRAEVGDIYPVAAIQGEAKAAAAAVRQAETTVKAMWWPRR